MQAQRAQAPIRIQDIRTLFRAREIVDRLTAEELGPAIERARAVLVATKGRRQYLEEILPIPVACAVPGEAETFVIECTGERRFHLRGGTMPLLWQIRDLEQGNGIQALRVIHHNGHGTREYWL